MESGGERAVATLASGLIGLLIGSFLNVVIYRLPRLESVVQPPSHCPACGTQLGAVDNIPVLSWLALRGKCRHCTMPISARYPIVELVTGVLFAAIALASPATPPLAPLDVVVGATLAIGMIALDDVPVPAVLEWVALGASATLVAVSVAEHHPGRLGDAALGGAVCLSGWLLSRLVDRVRRKALDYPSLTVCVAWGWTAGWTGFGAGLVVGIALVVLTLSSAVHPLPGRRTTALAAGLAIAAVVVGTISSG